MEIKLIKRAGVPKAEIEAHQRIQQEFDQAEFSKGWRGYASFTLARPGRGTGDDDFDLVLVTHTSIIIIELKNWNGKLIESNGHKWFKDGDDQGDSPVAVVNRKVPKLVSQMKQKLGPDKTPFVCAYVVMHGKIGKMDLPPEEARSVLSMEELLSFRFESCYRNYFRRGKINPLDFIDKYDEFFQGPSFKPKVYYVDGFRPDGEPIFSHPKGLYSEYRALAKDDFKTQALLRQWNFQALGLNLIGEGDRCFIGLREQRIFEYVSALNEELSLNLLRPLAHKVQKDVTIDFSELYRLPSRVARLTEFTIGTLPKIQYEERLGLVKTLINNFAQLHDLRVAHRDIGDHCIWVDRPAKIVLSGFPAAYYPEMQTVGSFREKIKVEQSIVPEDASKGTSTPYHRDVFMLGVLAYLILFGEKPPKVNGIYEWTPRAEDPSNGCMNSWFQKALNRDSASRFTNAREMLEALNAVTERKNTRIIDNSSFDAFKAGKKERDYQIIETLVDNEDYVCFRSEDSECACLVKVWYGVEPDERRPDISLRLLRFLERARAIKGCCVPGLPKVINFGLSKRSLLLVMSWVEGDSISDWLLTQPPIEARLKVAQSLVDTLERLHALELAHGDIHPRNIVIGHDDFPVFIDVLDFQLNSEDAYTTAYLPDNYKSLSPFERDRFGLAAVLAEALGYGQETSTREFAIPRVYEELSRLLTAEALSSLAPLKAALASAITKGDREEVPGFTIMVRNLAYFGAPPGEMRADNQHFHVTILPASKNAKGEEVLRFRVTGVGRQLFFGWNIPKKAIDFLRVDPVPQSVLLRTQIGADSRIRARLDLVDGPAHHIQEFLDYLLSDSAVKKKLPADAEKARSSVEIIDLAPIDTSQKYVPVEPNFKVSDIWRTLLEVEEEAFRTVVVAGEKRDSPYRNGQILIPYHADSTVIDYESTDKVLVQNLADGIWRECGQLSLRDTSFGQLAELAIYNPNSRANFVIGRKLRLISTLEKGSFNRRSMAVNRIVDEKAVIPQLIKYFDSNNEGLEISKYPAPTDADLDVYTQGGRELNPSQREAFKRVVGHGPVSLLQGPPGTGKTFFIAALLHYLITKERARRILLVSQAHEAVNNALEKALELCRSHNMPFDAVRLGSEAATSDPIRHFHSTSIEQSYRERFKAEQKERIIQLSSALGLPSGFASDFVELHLRLGDLERHIARLEGQLAKDETSSEGRVRSLTDTFFAIARDVYDLSDEISAREAVAQIENSLLLQHEIRSLDAVERLRKIIRLSGEWLGALGSPDGNFAEFLARSRTVVAGTCVGIGYRGAGVVQNVYDWVIIDEAGRAAASELAVAMQAGRRVLLVGDHRQLPPTFSEEVKLAINKRFGVEEGQKFLSSDFERLFDSEYGKQVGVTLLMQYRMAPVIGELVSSVFYNSQLECKRPDPPEYYDLLPEHFYKQVTWVDISPFGEKGYEQASEDGKDKWNEMEAKVILGILRDIIESDVFLDFLDLDLSQKEPGIGIICLYDKQRETIDRMKAEAPWLGDARRFVKVDTVDSYQGKENRIIILSTVRNNKQKKIGFLNSPNRINVAMSRAMERLIIVGSTHMWKGRNSELPLGRVLRKVEDLQREERAIVISAEKFVRT